METVVFYLRAWPFFDGAPGLNILIYLDFRPYLHFPVLGDSIV